MKVILSVILSLFIIGCAGRNIITYKEVKVPVKCIVNKPAKPSQIGDAYEDLKNILIYTEELEIIVEHCAEAK